MINSLTLSSLNISLNVKGKGKNFESYEYITVNILGKAKELYFSRKKIIEDKKSIAATRIELEDVINEAETKNDKISMLQKRL